MKKANVYLGGAVRAVGAESSVASDPEPTLTMALADLGYTHRKPLDPGAAPGAQEIIDATGAVVATLKASSAWEWIATMSGCPHEWAVTATTPMRCTTCGVLKRDLPFTSPDRETK